MRKKTNNPFLGRWCIVEMEQWDRDYIDLVAPGYIEFEKDGVGSFPFGTVQGGLDFRREVTDMDARIEISWGGANDMDPGSGRGWAEIRDGQLFGHLYIHLGDDSWFKAKRT